MADHEKNPFGHAVPLPDEDERLVDEYSKLNVPLDSLILSGLVDELVSAAWNRGDTRSREELLKRLLNLRKAGRLPRLGSTTTATPNALTITETSIDAAIDTAKDLLNRGVSSVRIAFVRPGEFAITYFDHS